MPIFWPHFTAYPNLMILSSTSIWPLCSSSSLLPHLVFSILPWPHRCSPTSPPYPFLAVARTYAYCAPRVWKSIASSRHFLNFQLTTLRSASPDTSVTSDQPLKHQIRHKLSQGGHPMSAMPQRWDKNTSCSDILTYEYFIQTLDQDLV